MSVSQEWYTFKILGKEVPRIKIREEDLDIDTKRCLGCNLSKGKYHKLGCDRELFSCPTCGDSIEAVDCPHEAYLEEETNDK